MVLLQPTRPKVRDRAANKSSDSIGLLEGDGERSTYQQEGATRGDAKDAGVLPWKSTEGQEDGLGHA